jgi:hypothetical protein
MTTASDTRARWSNWTVEIKVWKILAALVMLPILVLWFMVVHQQDEILALVRNEVVTDAAPAHVGGQLRQHQRQNPARCGRDGRLLGQPESHHPARSIASRTVIAATSGTALAAISCLRSYSTVLVDRDADMDDRVRLHTAAEVLERIDAGTERRILDAAATDPTRIAERLSDLDHEWDTDRTIELESAAVGLVGLALGAFQHKRFLALPAMVGAAVFLHATTGWYPLLPLLRRIGVRSPREIERERYALKALRGDFAHMGVEREHGHDSRSDIRLDS